MLDDKTAIIAARDEIARQYGPWTGHKIMLADGVSTWDVGHSSQSRVSQFADLIRKHAGPLERQRILDLACLEGLFAIEFARMGAETVGVEIREAHLAKAEFARETIGLQNCLFVQGDVRAIPAELGQFDVIIAAGILYHLDFPDCVLFLRQMAARARRALIIDSHFAYRNITELAIPLGPLREWECDGRIYWGRHYTEHAPNLSEDEKRDTNVWASIDNDRSVWLTEGSAIAELKRSKFFLADQIPNPQGGRPVLLFRRSSLNSVPDAPAW